jgi:hypothetical protein
MSNGFDDSISPSLTKRTKQIWLLSKMAAFLSLITAIEFPTRHRTVARGPRLQRVIQTARAKTRATVAAANTIVAATNAHVANVRRLVAWRSASRRQLPTGREGCWFPRVP